MSAFFYALTLLMAIIVVFDFSENVSRFMDHKVPWKDVVFIYYVNFIPHFFNLFIPLFTFISTIWFTSKLSSNNEIVAILSGGVNFYRMLVPYLAGALCIALFAIFMSNVVVPKANFNLQTFKSQQMSRWAKTTTNFHIRNSSDSYIYVDRWSISEQKGHMFSYNELDEHFVRYRLTAQEIRYDDSLKIWKLSNYTKRITSHAGEQLYFGTSLDTIFNITPLDLSQDEKACEAMTFGEIMTYIREDKEKGGGMSKFYIIEAHKRIANSMGVIIMTLLGLSVASRKNRRGVGVHLFFGIALAFTFVFLQQVSTVFSIYGGFSPALGTWMPNIIYAFVCVFMIRTCQK
ncbi:MAG: LptF/LptG family permease [Bacteroidetes bacterium]|nr:LptF/LptG family permease [Bacteroidota bacterium]MCL2302844.1 LptF/LptG family permease [Lentimicrobiaceae bacterium]